LVSEQLLCQQDPSSKIEKESGKLCVFWRILLALLARYKKGHLPITTKLFAYWQVQSVQAFR
jgi:hypothetical protein